MVFQSPQFFVLIPILIVVGWYFRRLKLWKPLRAAILLLIVFALTDPQIMRKQRGMDLFVLVDQSLSSKDFVDRFGDEWRTLLQRHKPSRHDNLKFIDYASEVVSKKNIETATYPGDRNLTRTGLAIQDTVAQVSPDRHSRLLLFTDGFSTEPLTGAAEKLVKMGIPLDYRLLKSEEVIDYKIAEVTMPSRVQIGEPFIVEMTVTGSQDGEVPFTVIRGGKKLTESKITVQAGVGRLRFTDRIVEPGAHRYQVRIDPETDAFPGNNSFENWIEIVAGPRILFVTSYENDPVIAVLRRQGFDVRVVEDSLTLQPGMLTGTRAVILNNVPAYQVPEEFLSALDFYVKEQ
ncbi:MAG: VWA domain-containing protein, partial [Verrucomicrobiota bacterium]